jgi:methionyl-tRNA formyltransferase
VRILLVAGEAAGLQTLRAVTRTSHELVAILAAPAPSGFKGATLEAQAAKSGVPVWPAALVKEPSFAARVREAEVDVLLNVHSLYVVAEAVLEAPALGAFNLHPGPLPRYAGRNAPLWAVFRGERTYGVTLHWMTGRIDAGPVAYQRLFPVDEHETGLSLSRKCAEAGVALVGELLRAAEGGPAAIPRLEQRLADREYLPSAVPHGGRVPWNRPAEEVLRFLRACDFRPFASPWGHPKATVEGRELEVVSVRPTGRPARGAPGTAGEAAGDGVEVACQDEALVVEDVLYEGRPTKAAALLRPSTAR